MIAPDRVLRRGAFLGGIIVFGAGILFEALHWFIAPFSQGDPPSTAMVAVEAGIGGALMIWGLLRLKKEARDLRTLAAITNEPAQRAN